MKRELRISTRFQKDESIMMERRGSMHTWHLEQEGESLHLQLQAQSSKTEGGHILEVGEVFCSQS